MKHLVKNIPNTFTLLNLFLGCIAVFMAFSGAYTHAAWLIIIAAIFDFLDGTAARMLKAYSELGKQLDSLADLVSFGLAPAAIMYSLLSSASEYDTPKEFIVQLAALPAFLVVICSALRLAKFNFDPSQSESFRGLPTPANALFIISLPFIRMQTASGESITALMGSWLGNYYVLLGITVLLSLLLVSGIPLMGFKIKSLAWSQNQYKVIFLSLSAMLILLLGVGAAPFVLLLYFVLSAVDYHRPKA
ncbi:MAG: CDP-diacylglycerol--serine O-phosphatidyltransferase [Bacteroidales bacterium]|nr:CDP-diacylglycerol--serine O-phosphatidyltransferase [Bacteroidales bacterium]MDZ4204577.1 CDP-diacylglycerol--serine O-phosphatidyltransferase [Bacteroidales bacterium]